MDLMDNIPDNGRKKTKVKLWFIIVMVLIIILIIAAAGIWMYSQNLAKNQFKFYIDGVKKTGYTDTMFLNDGTNTYVSISEIAPLLGNYKVFNGGYQQFTEDTTKCYANNSKEIVTFEAASNRIYKYNAIGESNLESQSFDLTRPIKTSGANLYICLDDLKRAFNVLVTLDSSKNTLSIFTLNNLAEYYSEQVQNAAITSKTSNFSEEVLFNNQKALLYNLVVVVDPDTKLYGVASLESPTVPIIGTRYSSLEFMEGNNDFIAKTSGQNQKVGIIASDGITKVRLEYDNISVIDKNLGLYLVTSNNKQGVVNKNGKTIVYQDYDQIGLNNNLVDQNVTNKYILFDNCIPVKRNGLWGIVDIEGKEILPLEYDGIGCDADNPSDPRFSDVIVIPELEAIVIEKDEVNGQSRVKKYGMVKKDGSHFINYVLDTVYSITAQGKTVFCGYVQNQIIDIVDFIYQEQAGNSNQTKENNDVNEQNNQNENNINNESHNKNDTDTLNNTNT